MARANTPQEIFDAMESRFLPEQAGDMKATIQFDLTGEGGGKWNAVVADRTLSVQPGSAASPSMVFTTSADDFVAIINGEMNAMSAFMKGRVRLKGDMAVAMKLQNLFKLD